MRIRRTFWSNFYNKRQSSASFSWHSYESKNVNLRDISGCLGVDLILCGLRWWRPLHFVVDMLWVIWSLLLESVVGWPPGWGPVFFPIPSWRNEWTFWPEQLLLFSLQSVGGKSSVLHLCGFLTRHQGLLLCWISLFFYGMKTSRRWMSLILLCDHISG